MAHIFFITAAETDWRKLVLLTYHQISEQQFDQDIQADNLETT